MHLDKCYSKATLNEKENIKNVELPKKEKLFTCCGWLRETIFWDNNSDDNEEYRKGTTTITNVQ